MGYTQKSKKTYHPSPTRPDSSGIRVEALATQNLATRIGTDSRETRHDERPSVLSKKQKHNRTEKILILGVWREKTQTEVDYKLWTLIKKINYHQNSHFITKTQ